MRRLGKQLLAGSVVRDACERQEEQLWKLWFRAPPMFDEVMNEKAEIPRSF